MDLDRKLRPALHESVGLEQLCVGIPRALPPLPPMTLPWVQDATHPRVVARRWASLQRYLDAALERVAESAEAFSAFKDFLCLV